MQQIQIVKRRTSATVRRARMLDVLPLDPRDPDIVRAKRRSPDTSGGKPSEQND